VREDWLSASVVNHTVLADLAIWQPIFSLSCHTWYYYYYYYLKSNDLSDTITRQQLQGHLTKSTDNVALLMLTVLLSISRDSARLPSAK